MIKDLNSSSWINTNINDVFMILQSTFSMNGDKEKVSMDLISSLPVGRSVATKSDT